MQWKGWSLRVFMTPEPEASGESKSGRSGDSGDADKRQNLCVLLGLSLAAYHSFCPVNNFVEIFFIDPSCNTDQGV